MTKQKIKLLIVAFLLTCTVSIVKAQPGGDPDDPDPNQPRTDIPFDGGLSLVAAAGIAYAAKKGYEKRKAKKEVEKN